MEGSTECFDALICSGARRLTGYQRRLFLAEVARELFEGSARQDSADRGSLARRIRAPGSGRVENTG